MQRVLLQNKDILETDILYKRMWTGLSQIEVLKMINILLEIADFLVKDEALLVNGIRLYKAEKLTKINNQVQYSRLEIMAAQGKKAPFYQKHKTRLEEFSKYAEAAIYLLSIEFFEDDSEGAYRPILNPNLMHLQKTQEYRDVMKQLPLNKIHCIEDLNLFLAKQEQSFLDFMAAMAIDFSKEYKDYYPKLRFYLSKEEKILLDHHRKQKQLMLTNLR